MWQKIPQMEWHVPVGDNSGKKHASKLSTDQYENDSIDTGKKDAIRKSSRLCKNK